ISNDAFFFRGNEPDNAIYFTLSENSSTYKTTISFQMNDLASDGLDTTEYQDIMHLTTGVEKCPNMSIYSDDSLVRKNWIKADMKDKSFKLLTEFQNDGYYTISTENLGSFEA